MDDAWYWALSNREWMEYNADAERAAETREGDL